MKGLGAVDEHRREGLAREESTLIDLADVGDEVGLDAARLADERVQSPQQLVVGDIVQGESRLVELGDGGLRAVSDSGLGAVCKSGLGLRATLASDSMGPI